LAPDDGTPFERTGRYTLGQAARAVGKAKSTLSRDVKRGRISATRNDDGSVTIDPAELHRVYPPAVAAERSNGSENGESNDRQRGAGTAATGFAWREIELLRERLAEKDSRITELIADHAELVREKDARIADKEAVIEDLRRRLDQTTRLLTDQRSSPMPATPDPPRNYSGATSPGLSINTTAFLFFS
jgi:hypothetical protein